MKNIEEASKEHEQQFGFNSEGEINSSPAESFKEGVEFAQQWISVEDELPTGEDEVLLFNEKWINEDFNPRGIRIGFLGGEGFISAHWWNYQDCYMTISKFECEDNPKFSDEIKNNTEPTHWRPINIE